MDPLLLRKTDHFDLGDHSRGEDAEVAQQSRKDGTAEADKRPLGSSPAARVTAPPPPECELPQDHDAARADGS